MKKLVVLATVFFAATAAQAAGVGVRVGTTGVGGDVAWGVLPTVSARIGYSALSWSRRYDTNVATYDGKLKLSNLSALAEFHPLGPVFRISGGLIFNTNKFESTGQPSSGPGSFNATVESGRKAAPYLGIGFGRVAGTGIGLYGDLGLMFMGSPKATVNANCSGLTALQCSTLQGQAASEQARLQDDMKSFKAFPVLNIGVSVGF
jgi:hypothetical protein